MKLQEITNKNITDILKSRSRHKLSASNIKGYTFRKKKFTGLSILNSSLYSCIFQDCLFKNVDFISCNINHTRFINCHFEDCHFIESTFYDTYFYQCIFEGSEFRACLLKDYSIAKCSFCTDSYFEACAFDETSHEKHFKEFKDELLIASCSWSTFGETGRMITLIEYPGIGLKFDCGCFMGSPEDLKNYIERSTGLYKASRMRAYKFLMACMNDNIKIRNKLKKEYGDE